MAEIQDVTTYPRVKIDFSPVNPPLKKAPDKTKIDVRYSLIAPFSSVHIYWNPKIYELIYEIEEPLLDKTEEAYRDQIVDAMRDIINFDSVVEKEPDKLLEYLDKRFKFLAVEFGMNMSYETYQNIYY